MERVTGIGGIFFKSSDPAALRRWYAENLGIPDEEYGTMFGPTGDTVWAPFAADTEYFAPSDRPFMVNYRVESLDRMLVQLRAAGVQMDVKQDDLEYGRFAWGMDPDGNRFELWEPPAAPQNASGQS